MDAFELLTYQLSSRIAIFISEMIIRTYDFVRCSQVLVDQPQMKLELICGSLVMAVDCVWPGKLFISMTKNRAGLCPVFKRM
jgi:hypothetical protein